MSWKCKKLKQELFKNSERRVTLKNIYLKFGDRNLGGTENNSFTNGYEALSNTIRLQLQNELITAIAYKMTWMLQ